MARDFPRTHNIDQNQKESSFRNYSEMKEKKVIIKHGIRY